MRAIPPAWPRSSPPGSQSTFQLLWFTQRAWPVFLSPSLGCHLTQHGRTRLWLIFLHQTMRALGQWGKNYIEVPAHWAGEMKVKVLRQEWGGYRTPDPITFPQSITALSNKSWTCWGLKQEAPGALQARVREATWKNKTDAGSAAQAALRWCQGRKRHKMMEHKNLSLNVFWSTICDMFDSLFLDTTQQAQIH